MPRWSRLPCVSMEFLLTTSWATIHDSSWECKLTFGRDDSPQPGATAGRAEIRSLLAQGESPPVQGYQGWPWTGWVPPLTVSSPLPTGALQAAHTVSGWNSAPHVCSETTGSPPGVTCWSPHSFSARTIGRRSAPAWVRWYSERGGCSE